MKERPIDEVKIAYDEKGIAYMLEATGNDAKYINYLLTTACEGRLIILPCKIGQIVYLHYPFARGVYEAEVCEISCSKDSNIMVLRDLYFNRREGINFERIGKSVFLSREEAEKALKGADDGKAD